MKEKPKVVITIDTKGFSLALAKQLKLKFSETKFKCPLIHFVPPTIWAYGKSRIKKWKEIKHVYVISLVLILAIISGKVLEKYTNAVFPFLDAFTTFGAIITTYMVAKKIIENWIYWFVIDSISIYLFFSRELYLTSLLFFIYLIIIIFGICVIIN